MPPGGRRREERRRVLVQPRPIVESRTGLSARASSRPSTATSYRRSRPPLASTSWRRLGADARAERPGQQRHRHVRRCQRHPPVRREAVVRHALVPLAGVGLATPAARPPRRPPSVAAALTASPALVPEKPHRVPVPRLPGPWATTATSARTHVGRGEQAGVDVDRLVGRPPNACPTVTVEASHPASRQRRHRAGEGQRAARRRRSSRRRPARPAPARAARRAPPAGRSAGRPRRPASRPRSSASRSSLVVRALLLVDAEDHRLQRGVAGLDHVPRPRGRVGRQPVGQGDHERQAPGAQPPLQRADVQQHPVTGLRGCRPRPGRPARAPARRLASAEAHVVLHRTGPRRPDPFDRCAAPVDHAAQTSPAGVGYRPRP